VSAHRKPSTPRRRRSRRDTIPGSAEAAGVAVLVLMMLFGIFTVAHRSQDVTPPPAAQQASAPRQQQPPRELGAPTALHRINVAAPSTYPVYRRDKFGSGWADLDHDGCNTREEILARDMTDLGLEDNCNVLTGTLHDPYTGRTIDYNESVNAASVQIDHVVSLSSAWRQGASNWTAAKRIKFANDPLNLIAVDGPTNQSKGDSGPATWQPPNTTFRCAWDRRYVQVTYKYRLTLPSADWDTLETTLAGCKKR
jgi:hypothetical protein